MTEPTTRTCPVCGAEFTLKPKGGHRVYCSERCRVAAHRQRHQLRAAGTANQRALEAMLAGYVIQPAMAAKVQAARSLAAGVDGQPYNAGLWARYQAALAELAPLVADDEDAVFERLIAEINSRAPVRSEG